MFSQVHFPETLLPHELDSYLERGWFRMGQTIFTTNFLNFKNQFYSAIWLRIELPQYRPDKTQQMLMKRNASLKVEIKKASVTPAKEELYSRYKAVVSFDASPSLSQLLYRNTSRNIFDTWEINIYDRTTLVACGFFDIGRESGAGIISFYHPDYKKNSLGKYLIYQKMDYCQKLNLRYFYPGYFVPGYPYFDYKLSIGKSALQFLQFKSQQWLPMVHFAQTDIPFQLMLEKLNILHQVLAYQNIESSVLRYAYFDANLVPELSETVLFDFPLFLTLSGFEENGLYPIIVIYDLINEKYHLLKCFSVWTSAAAADDTGVYSAHLLKVEDDLFSESNPDLMKEKLLVLTNLKQTKV